MATIVSSALFAACTPSVSPTASPTPSPPATSASPTETEFQRQERVAYEGAEAAYRGFRSEYTRVITHSFSPKITAKMNATAGGPYLRTYRKFLRERRRRAIKSTAGIEVKSLERIAYRTDSVLLRACEDGSKGRLVDNKGKVVGKGTSFRIHLEVKLIDGQWKTWVGDRQEDVASCEP